MKRYEHPAVIFDFETRSEADLPAVGHERYARDPSTDIICLWYAVGTKGSPLCWTPGQRLPHRFIDAVSEGYLYYADNVPFDRAIWKHVLDPKYGVPYPGDEFFMDLAVLKCYVGLPRSVEEAARALKVSQKDAAGHKVMKRISKPRKATKKDPDIWSHYTAEAVDRVIEYGKQDIVVECQIAEHVPMMPTYVRRAWEASERMNARGVRVDVPFVDQAIRFASRHKNKLREQLAKVTDGEVLTEGQTERLGEWLTQHGIQVPKSPTGKHSINKENVGILVAQAEQLDGTTGERVRAALDIRAELNKAAVAKYAAMKRCHCDGYLYGLLKFYGAHTGRWTAELVQSQNMRGMVFDSSEEFAMARHLVAEGDVSGFEFLFGHMYTDALASLTRAAFVASEGCRLQVMDYSSIEGRGLAWLAGEKHVIDAYRAGKDMYKVNASGIFGVPYDQVDGGGKGPQRNAGKVSELACGYQGGPGAIHSFARKLRLDIDDALAIKIRDGWRATRPNTCALWRGLERAAIEACKVQRKVVHVDEAGGRIAFQHDGEHLRMRLPSGRCLYYREAHLRDKEMPWTDDNGNPIYRPAVFYYGVNPEPGRKDYVLLDMYGGKWTENAVQGMCADLIYEAIPRLERAGFRPNGTVHDEILSDDPIDRVDIDRFAAVMSEPPAWVDDNFPIAAAGFVSPYYKKE